MERKNNFRVLNLCLTLAFVGIFFVVVIIDFLGFVAEKPVGTLIFWRFDQNIVNWTDDGPAKVVAAIVSCFAASVFFIIGKKYNVIRRKKHDNQLSTQIYLSLVYMGIARLFEAYFIVSDSSLRGIVFSVGKYYIVLDILGVIMFVLVSSEVFLQTEIPAGSKLPAFLRGLLIASASIALGALFLDYAPGEIVNILDWCVIGASIVVFLIIAIILIVICIKILRLFARLSENENRGAIFVIGIQLLLLIASVFLLIYLEVGPGDAEDYYLRALRCGLLLVVALLYMPSFIMPSLKKKEES